MDSTMQDTEHRVPTIRSWDYQALLIQEALGRHPGTKPGSAEAQRQMTEAAVATREAASNASAPGHARIAVDPILYPVRLPGRLKHAQGRTGCPSAPVMPASC